jgi:diacylglycerol kinase (ATP)
MSRKIIYLINPISGTHGKSSLQELITRRTQGQGIDFSILPTMADGNYDYLLPVIEREAVTDIVVCGGDGTVSAVAAALTGTDTRIGIIPMGSGNGLAFAAGIPKDPSKALDIVFSGNASPIDGFMINGRFSCMLCGIGFDGGVAHEFARQKKRGLLSYVRVTFSHFFKARAYPFTIGLSGRSFPLEAFFIDIANGNQFGNHVTIAPRANLRDGLLDIVVVKKMSRFRFLFSVILQVFGANALRGLPADTGKKKVLYFQTPSLTIANPSEAPLHIDGDPSPTSRELVVTVAPKAILLIQP